MTYTDINNDISFITGTGTSEYEAADRVRNVNNWYLQVASWIFEADGRWQWDDANQTNMPSATTNLVSDQKDYLILAASPSSGQDWLQIDRVEITDDNDEQREIMPLDQTDLKGVALDEFMDTPQQPEYYDFRGNSIFLYPAPNYNKSGGLTVYFKRSPLLFATTDTTKQPGFATPYHKILSLGASYDWAVSKGDNNIDRIRQELEILKKGLKDFYSKRDKYEIPKLKRRYSSYK